MPDPIDPDASTFTDIAEGATDGQPVESQRGSELIEGGDD